MDGGVVTKYFIHNAITVGFIATEMYIYIFMVGKYIQYNVNENSVINSQFKSTAAKQFF